MKKITAVNIAAVILAVSLTASGSSGVENVPDETIPAPETYEDYMKLAAESYAVQDWETTLAFYQGAKELGESSEEVYRRMSDTYLQMDDVLQALAVLDEGIEKLSAEGQGVEEQGVDLLSQRKDYLLANVVAIQTKITESHYDADGNITYKDVTERDRNGNEIKDMDYGAGEQLNWITEYDSRGNEIKREHYDADGKITSKVLMEYDESGHEIKYVRYDAEGNAVEKGEHEYDENGNAVKYVHYDGLRSVDHSWESEYDENGNEIKHIEYDSEGNVNSIQESEYNDSGARIACESLSFVDEKLNERCNWTYEYDKKGRETRYETVTNDGEGNVIFHYKRESEYDDYGIRTRYYEITENEEENIVHAWERIYDEFEHEFIEMFFLSDEQYGDDYYWAATEYDKNRSEARYTGYDADGNILTYIETKYDTDGNIISENQNDGDGNLLRHYETEYDDFGSITMQAAYEGDILKFKKEVEYTYRYIGDINAEASDFADADMTAEELNDKQRDIFMQFLEGKEKVRFYSNMDYVRDDRIVAYTITDLVYSDDPRFAVDPYYAFMDMTGDGIDELVIRCSENKLYVIQCVYGTLRVIQEAVGGIFGTHLARYGEKIGICCEFGGAGYYRQEYYFLDENFLNKNGKKLITLEERKDYNEDGEEIRVYSARDNISFEYRDISEGEYYDIAGKMIWIPDSYIEWYTLEEPNK